MKLASKNQIPSPWHNLATNPPQSTLFEIPCIFSRFGTVVLFYDNLSIFYFSSIRKLNMRKNTHKRKIKGTVKLSGHYQPSASVELWDYFVIRSILIIHTCHKTKTWKASLREGRAILTFEFEIVAKNHVLLCWIFINKTKLLNTILEVKLLSVCHTL